MTGTCRRESEQFVASAEGAEEAAFISERDEGGRHSARRLELSVDTASHLEKAVKFAQGARGDGMTDFPDPTSNEFLVDTSRIPSAAGWGASSVSEVQVVAANGYTAVDLGALGLWVR